MDVSSDSSGFTGLPLESRVAFLVRFGGGGRSHSGLSYSQDWQNQMNDW